MKSCLRAIIQAKGPSLHRNQCLFTIQSAPSYIVISTLLSYPCCHNLRRTVRETPQNVGFFPYAIGKKALPARCNAVTLHSEKDNNYKPLTNKNIMKKSILSTLIAITLGATTSLAHGNMSPANNHHNGKTTVVIVKECDKRHPGNCVRHKKISHKGHTRPVKNCACNTCNKLRRKHVSAAPHTCPSLTWRSTGPNRHLAMTYRHR